MQLHLSSCAHCQELYQCLQQEEKIYHHYQLERKIDVDPKLWQSLERELFKTASPKSRLFPSLPQWLMGLVHVPRLSAAVTALLVIISIVTTIVVMKQWQIATELSQQKNANEKKVFEVLSPSIPPVSTEIVAENNGVNGANNGDKENSSTLSPAVVRDSKKPKLTDKEDARRLIREAEEKYLAAISILSRDIKRRGLDNETIDKFNEALAVIDKTIAETRRAVRQNPEDPTAVGYLLTAYNQKVEVMKEMASY